MQAVVEITKTIGSMPPGMLVGCVILAGFGLAAFAIHAVVTVAKDRR